MSSTALKIVHYTGQKKVAKPEGKFTKKKEGRKKRKAWDTTTTDLSVHKLSKEEIGRRHTSHQSKNAELAKYDLYDKAKENVDLDSSGNLRPSPLALRGGVLLRSLQGKELHEVLAESDRALRVVKDMFGDDPMRYTCQPNVTVAPHIVKNKATLERTLQESYRDGPPPTALASPGGIKDERIQELAPRKPALNELPNAEGNYEDDFSIDSTLTPHTTTPQGRCYKPSIDLKRFQELIAKEEKTDTNHDLSHQGKADSLQLSQDVKTVARKKPVISVQFPIATADNESLSGLSNISSIPGPQLEGGQGLTKESTASLQKKGSVSRYPSEHPLQVTHKMTPRTTHSMQGELDELEKVVCSLTKELQELESTSPLTTTAHSVNNIKLTSIVSTLLTSVTQITRYLCESEAQLKGEVEVRGHLLQTMTEQQNLMDALTSDVVKLQKEKTELKKALKEVKHTTSKQLLSMQREISEVHKKLSTLAIQAIPPIQARQLATTPKSFPSPPIPSTSVARTKSQIEQNVTARDTNAKQFFHQPSLNSSPSISSMKSECKPHPVLDQNAHLPHLMPNQSDHGNHSSPYIRAQKSPLNYNVTPFWGSSDSCDSSQNFGDIVPDTIKDLSSYKELTPVSDGFVAGDPPLEYTLSADSYAPPPPPLSIALQVPSLESVRTNTKSSEIIYTAPKSSVGANNGPTVDVTGFLNSLKAVENKNLDDSPHFLYVTDPLSSSILTSGHVSLVTTMPSLLSISATSLLGVQPSLQKEPIAQSVDVSEPVSSPTSSVMSSNIETLLQPNDLSTFQQGLQAPDLSVSLFSAATEDSPNTNRSLNPHEGWTKTPMVVGNMLLHPQQAPSKQNGWFSLASHVSHS